MEVVDGFAGVAEARTPEDVGLWPPDDAVEVGTGDEFDEVDVDVEVDVEADVEVEVDVDEHAVKNDVVSTISATPTGIELFICANPSSTSGQYTKMTHERLVSTDADDPRSHELFPP